MENVQLESQFGSDLGVNDIATEAPLRLIPNAGALVPAHFNNLMHAENGGATDGFSRKHEIYEAVVSLSRSIAGRTDLRSLLSGVAESLRQIVTFDHVALILHDPNGNVMEGY